MASIKCLTNLVLVKYLIATTLLFNLSNATSELVEKVCKRYTDYEFCKSTFLSDARSDTADLHRLGLLSIQITSHKLHETLNKFPDLRGKITDPVGRKRLNVCESDYKTADEKFNGAFGSMSKNAYSDVINWVRDGTNAVIDCQNIYRKSDPLGESPISADNLNVVNLSGVILTANDMLMGL